jgi:hypothetical protein
MAYTPSEIETLFKKVLKAVEGGEPLGRTLSEKGMPSRTSFYTWLEEIKGYSERYARACELRADAIFEEIFDIADETSRDTIITEKGEIPNSEWINRSRLRVDARKWALSKMNPKKYGDKLDVTSGNKPMAMPAIVGMVIKNETPSDEPTDDDLF